VELLDPAALKADDVIMVLSLIEFKHRLVALEVAPH
jgi:hypothetical protein